MPKLSEIRKALTPLVVGLVGWATLVINSPSASITAAEWVALLVVVATGVGVYYVPNEPSS